MATALWDVAFTSWAERQARPPRLPRPPLAAFQAAQALYDLIERESQIFLGMSVEYNGANPMAIGTRLATLAMNQAGGRFNRDGSTWQVFADLVPEIEPVAFTAKYDGNYLRWDGETAAGLMTETTAPQRGRVNPCHGNPNPDDDDLNDLVDRHRPQVTRAPAGLMEDLARSLPAVCRRDHKALKQGGPAWESLTLIGYQDTEDDDGTPRVIELRNCTCGNTLGRLLPSGVRRP